MNRLTFKLTMTALCTVLACCTGNSKNQEKKGQTMNTKAEIYLAGGCFWGTEHFLKQIDGVTDTQTGYANGHGKNPSYQEVCTDKTGFAEAVRVAYNPERASITPTLTTCPSSKQKWRRWPNAMIGRCKWRCCP